LGAPPPTTTPHHHHHPASGDLPLDFFEPAPPNFSPNVTRAQARGLPSALELSPPLSALGDLPAANFKWLLVRLGFPAGGEVSLAARDALYASVLLPLCGALGGVGTCALALLAPAHPLVDDHAELEPEDGELSWEDVGE
jgi:hypothetical protein